VLEAALPESLFEKQCWKLSFQASPPALDCVNRGLTFAPVKKGAEDGVMHDYFSLLLTALYNIYYLYK